MTKTFFIVGLLLLLLSCDSKHDVGLKSPKSFDSDLEKDTMTETMAEESMQMEAVHTEDPGDEVGHVPHEAFLFDADLTLSRFSKKDEAKVEKAIEIIKRIVASQEFKNRIINFTYEDRKQFVDNDNLSNEEIYQKLLDGSEKLSPGVDHIMNLNLKLYYSKKTTVGYTYANGSRIWMNTKFFDKFTPAQVAGNIFHEWTHKLGFKHASNYSIKRDSSVPYAIGYLVRELGKQYE